MKWWNWNVFQSNLIYHRSKNSVCSRQFRLIYGVPAFDCVCIWFQIQPIFEANCKLEPKKIHWTLFDVIILSEKLPFSHLTVVKNFIVGLGNAINNPAKVYMVSYRKHNCNFTYCTYFKYLKIVWSVFTWKTSSKATNQKTISWKSFLWDEYSLNNDKNV